MILYLVIFFESFLIGSIPFGLLISKYGYDRDLRKYGSGNIGTTNAFRALGKIGGSLTFFLDTVKGYLGGLFALMLVAAFADGDVGGFVWQSITAPIAPAANAIPAGIALLGGVAGHVFSPWLKFKGGKGVAVAGGSLFVLFGWAFGAVELAIFGLVIVISKYVSLGSLCAALACPIIACVLFWGRPVPIVCCVIACAPIVAKKLLVTK